MRPAEQPVENGEGGDDRGVALGQEVRQVRVGWAIYEQVTEHVDTGVDRHGEVVPPESGAIAIIAAVNGVAATWLACPDLFSPAHQAEALAQVVLHGILPRKE
ncbi:hypothetical protein ACXIZN_25535 [Amycolatopsis sp. TRM77291]